jgi:rubrerythrin
LLMFRESANLAGALQCSDEDQDAGRQSNQVNQKNKRTEIESESEETIDDQIEREQDHSEFFHAPIFVLAASLCRDVSLEVERVVPNALE